MAHSPAGCSVPFDTTNNKATCSPTGIRISHSRIRYDVDWGVVHPEQDPFCVSNQFPEILALLGTRPRSQGWWVQIPEELEFDPEVPTGTLPAFQRKYACTSFNPLLLGPSSTSTPTVHRPDDSDVVPAAGAIDGVVWWPGMFGHSRTWGTIDHMCCLGGEIVISCRKHVVSLSDCLQIPK